MTERERGKERGKTGSGLLEEGEERNIGGKDGTVVILDLFYVLISLDVSY